MCITTTSTLPFRQRINGDGINLPSRFPSPIHVRVDVVIEGRTGPRRPWFAYIRTGQVMSAVHKYVVLYCNVLTLKIHARPVSSCTRRAGTIEEAVHDHVPGPRTKIKHSISVHYGTGSNEDVIKSIERSGSRDPIRAGTVRFQIDPRRPSAAAHRAVKKIVVQVK